MADYDCGDPSLCTEENRWECSQMSGWMSPDGRYPWGEDTPEVVLRYLAAMTAEEQVALADEAARELDYGGWQGVETANGGWIDDGPWDDKERAWRATAADFLLRHRAGDRSLGEGMIAYASWDLARELAWIRGWCPLQDAPQPRCEASSSAGRGTLARWTSEKSL